MIFHAYDYDVKDEIDAYKACTTSNLKKFLMYKSRLNERMFDCDRGFYAKAMYHQLWGFKISRYYFEQYRLGSVRFYAEQTR